MGCVTPRAYCLTDRTGLLHCGLDTGQSPGSFNGKSLQLTQADTGNGHDNNQRRGLHYPAVNHTRTPEFQVDAQNRPSLPL